MEFLFFFFSSSSSCHFEGLCPSGKAWFDLPTANNVAHGQAECSNMGICNRVTGVCSCHSGFTGSSCERGTCYLSLLLLSAF